MNIRNIQFQEKGSALIVALFFIMILTVIGLSLLFNTSLDNVISNNYAKNVRATYTAQSGIERFKALLLYDYKHDPAGWSNQYMVVPQGSRYVDGTLAQSAATIGGSGSDAYFDLCPVATCTAGSIPSTTPYEVNPNIPYAKEATLYAQVNVDVSHPIVIPGSGYQLMMRNVPNTRGGTCVWPGTDCDPNSVFVLSIGRTTATRAYLNSTSQGMNLIEDGLFGDDISVWNNIFFAGDNDLSGGGAMTIHGNVHILGPSNPPPPLATSVVLDVKADILNSYYYGNANKSLKNPLKSTLSVPQQRDSASGHEAYAVNNLKAKVRVRNGLIDISHGNARIGEPAGTGIPFDVVATCRKCPSPPNYSNGFNQASPQAYAAKFTNYNVPANLQSLIKVPAVSDQYKDPATNVIYPTYTDYFVGMHSYNSVTYDLPGALGLKLAAALGFDSSMVFSNTLAQQIWNAKTPIFTQNVRQGAVSQEQQVLDPLTGETDPLFNPAIGNGPTDGKTFMIVAADTAQHVVVVYKEVAPFRRSVDHDLDGAQTAVDVDFPRVIHGFVFAPAGTDMKSVTLKVDIDGDDVDGGDNWIFDDSAACNPLQVTPPTGCRRTLTTAESNQLIRKVTNALWKAARGECGVLGPCYSSVSKDTWEASMNSTPNHVYETSGTNNNNLRVPATDLETENGKLIAYGAIETPDQISLGNFLYMGRFTLYTRNSGGSAIAPNIGRATITAPVYALQSYRYPAATNPPTYVAFPCQNNMGIMAAENIDLGGTATHDVFGGAFYAGGTFILTKQQQLIGAIVAGSWDFGNGGTPDFFQAMEISRCLPPYIIAKDVIVFADSQSWLER
jgi:PilX N-terminal